MLLIVIGDIVLDGESLRLARDEAAKLETYKKWSESDRFKPYRIHGRTFRNVAAWQAYSTGERVRAYLCQAAGVPYK